LSQNLVGGAVAAGYDLGWAGKIVYGVVNLNQGEK